MQESTYESDEQTELAKQCFAKAGIATEKVGDKKLRSFHRGDTEQELQNKLRQAYDVAMSDGLATMVHQLRIGRNDPCPCGSPKKFKKCCMWKCQ